MKRAKEVRRVGVEEERMVWEEEDLALVLLPLVPPIVPLIFARVHRPAASYNIYSTIFQRKYNVDFLLTFIIFLVDHELPRVLGALFPRLWRHLVCLTPGTPSLLAPPYPTRGIRHTDF